MTTWAERTDEDRAEIAKTWTREIPLAYNGYCAVAMQSIRVRADEVKVGDTLILDGFVSLVRTIGRLALANEAGTTILPAWFAVHILGDINVIRFPHELVSVLRRGE